MKKENIAEPVPIRTFNLLRIKIPWIYAGLSQVLFTAVIWLGLASFSSHKEGDIINTKFHETEESLVLIRGNSPGLSHPLRLTDPFRESPGLLALRDHLDIVVNQHREQGGISKVSLYFRSLSDGRWFSINGDAGYIPGSILKVPVMMAFMKMEEEKPGVLNRKVTFDRPIANPKSETYRESPLKLGNTYTIRELIENMIVHSDNIATTLLLMNMFDSDRYRKVYSELGLPVPAPFDPDFRLTAAHISRFLRVLYNASFLNEKNSHDALELLTRATFSEGMSGGVPAGTRVAHKFGEAGDNVQLQFSETGIFYHPEKPYLLTVMTEGSDSRLQAGLIRDLSAAAWEFMGQ
ncbi:MAG TPA: class A beta-lactamase-related serine hydrolase [Bacteroidales bacterium]|nr:class A beta-lactamase-related serine hydrolase [Bacteroidales bacterium]HSA42391.1 class A beta-lactamase-related serine hydrolase [Bacteroidales bacterium]